MKEEINDELRQLLDALEEHGRNARRQKELGALMDRLAEEEKTEELPHKQKKLAPLWWAMGAAAACLLLWLLVKPATEQNVMMNEEIFVEETNTVDSIRTNINDAVLEKPIILEEPLAEEVPVAPQKTQIVNEKPKEDFIEKVVEQPIFAEATPTKSEDTPKDIGPNPIPTENETPSTIQKPQRRVIRSLNLVCYDCKKEPEPGVVPKPNMDNRTLFGQPQDPNMKNGSLAFEFRLN